MRRVQSNKKINLIVLLAAALLALIFAGTSLSRFVFEEKDSIRGSYTNFILEHNGAGQTAILQERSAGDGTENVAYLLVSLYNYEQTGAADAAVSARQIVYSIRSATGEEIEGGIQNAWGDDILSSDEVSAESVNYTISLADDAGNPLLDPDSEEYKNATTLGQDSTEDTAVRDSRTVMLKIVRSSAAPQLGDGESERLTIVLETSRPYRDVRAFNVTIVSGLISASVSENTYFGFTEKRVNIRTSVNFDRGTEADNVSYGAELTFTVSGGIVFDIKRFQDQYCVGENPNVSVDESAESGGVRIYTVCLLPGSDVNLHFYTVGGAYQVLLSAKVNGDTENYAFLSGLGQGTADHVFTVMEG